MKITKEYKLQHDTNNICIIYTSTKIKTELETIVKEKKDLENMHVKYMKAKI